MTVAICPIVAQTFGGGGQNARRQIPHLDTRKDQKPGVVGNAVQVAATLPVVPADEPVSRGQLQGLTVEPTVSLPNTQAARLTNSGPIR